MRFPLALTVKFVRHIVKHKLLRTPRFAIVLQLEPLHTCNLTCTGCGRIREYSTSLKDMMSLEDCLAAARGMRCPHGLHLRGRAHLPKFEELVVGLRDQGRIVYICTNAMFMRKEAQGLPRRHYPPPLEPTLVRLLAEKLIPPKTPRPSARAGPRNRPVIAQKMALHRTSMWTAWNIPTT